MCLKLNHFVLMLLCVTKCTMLGLYMLTATSIWSSLGNYERCSCNCLLWFPGKKQISENFQMMFAVKEGEIQTQNRALGQI